MHQLHERRAFTLIELLVVIIVLAILTAIAVPNLQLAGTRAKITRVRADFSTIATGLELYHTDNTAYPPENDITTTPTLLSTPVAYLPNMNFRDPFYKPNPYGESVQDSHYRYNNFAAVDERDAGTDFHINQYGAYWNYAGFPFASGGRMVIDDKNNITSLMPYDATNGLVSTGRIIRGQKQT